jgi:hypothetical protein
MQESIIAEGANPNFTFDRTAGSRWLAAAGHRMRSMHGRGRGVVGRRPLVSLTGREAGRSRDLPCELPSAPRPPRHR